MLEEGYWYSPTYLRVALLICFVGIVAYYSFNTPFFEAPDEYYHFAVIEYIARTGEHPPTDNPQNSAWQQMTFHAPLYYYTAALLIAAMDTRDFLTNYPRNPHAQVGNTAAEDNQNFVAHVEDRWTQTGLAVRVVRFYSMAWGLLTLGGVYWLARQLTSEKVALLAVLLLTIQPQFVYLNGMITNDVMVTALCTWAMALCVYIIRQSATPRRVFALAVILACASLTKTSGLTIYPAAILTLAYVAYRDQLPFRRWLGYGSLIGMVWFVLAGWWYYGNWVNLHDPFGTNSIAHATGFRQGTVDWTGELTGMYYSYWGLFGWFNILAPPLFYRWTGVLLLVGLLGIGWGMRRARPNRELSVMLAILSLTVVVLLISWWQFNQQVLAAQGRLLFPVISLLTVTLAWGLAQVPMRSLTGILIGGMAVATLYFPAYLIQPTFAAPEQQPIITWEAPRDAVPIQLREPWQPEACLTLWATAPRIIRSRELVMDVYWAATCKITGYWSEFVHLSDPNGETCEAGDTRHILAQHDSMLGGGKLPLPALQVGNVFHEELRLTLPENMVDNAYLQIGMYDAGGTFSRMMVGQVPLDQNVITVRECAPDAVSIALAFMQIEQLSP